MQRRRRRKRTCPGCGEAFEPDARQRKRGLQKYCSKEACQQASKAASQRRWLARPQNRRYFSGPEHLLRVSGWRGDHPGYWRQKRGTCGASLGAALQDVIDKQPVGGLEEIGTLNLPLQETMVAPAPRLLQLRLDFRTGGVRDDDQAGAGA